MYIARYALERSAKRELRKGRTSVYYGTSS